MATNVRAAVATDADAVQALAERFVTSFALEPAAFRASFEALSRDPAACLLVADIGERVVGYLLGSDTSPSMPTVRSGGSRR